MNPDESVSRRFADIAGRFADPDVVLQHLIAAYAEPHRRYHTLEHIVEMLDCFQECRHLADNPIAIILAIWFHDIVYVVKATGGANEQASADWLRGLAHGRDIDTAIALIRHSAHHGASDDNDTRIFCDLDLYRLGAPAFVRHNDDIRFEYGFVPEDEWRRRRADFLNSMLARPEIFQTGYWRGRLESRARANLAAVISDLTG